MQETVALSCDFLFYFINLSQILIREKCTLTNSVRTLNKSKLNIAIVYICKVCKTLALKHVDIRKQNVGSARCIVGLTASPSWFDVFLTARPLTAVEGGRVVGVIQRYRHLCDSVGECRQRHRRCSEPMNKISVWSAEPS